MLNNRGWGFRSYIIASSVLLLFLLLVTFLVIRLYSGLSSIGKKEFDTASYTNIEDSLNNLAVEYVKEYKDSQLTTGVITVSTKTLIDNKMLNKSDLEVKNADEKDTCSGYSLVRRDSNNILYSESYIKCEYYTTNEYQSWRVE